jgi:dihydroneopterin aldolase
VDKIVIKELEVEARIGVSEEERAAHQRLSVTVVMELDLAEAARTDEEAVTVRYDAVADLVRQVVTERPRKLIESAAGDIAKAILARQMAQAVTVEVKKFSVPRSQHVSVQIRRTQEAAGR